MSRRCDRSAGLNKEVGVLGECLGTNSPALSDREANVSWSVGIRQRVDESSLKYDMVFQPNCRVRF